MVITFSKLAFGLLVVVAFIVRKSSAQTAAPATSALAPTGAPVDAGWGGCVDPTNADELVELGKKTTICITLSSSAAWNIPPPSAQTLRLSFQPIADEYSRFHVPSSYKDLIEDKSTRVFDGSGNVTIHVASQKVLSFQRMFYSQSGGAGQVFPYLTAIIDVKKGVVNGITWDDACLFCSDDKCLENTYDFNGNLGTQSEYKQPTKGCYLAQPECLAITTAAATSAAESGVAKPPPCDILIYFVWTGDDKNGRALQSSAFRFSAFPEQELQNRLKDSLPDIPNFGFGGGDENTGSNSGA